MKTRLFVFFLACATTLSFAFQSAPVSHITGQQSFFDRLSTPSPTRAVEVTLALDMAELQANKRTEEFFPSVFTYQGQSWDIETRVRGRYRRRVCELPPLRLKFNKRMLAAGGLSTHNSFKLVTHCGEGPEAEEAVLREQLTYELYNLLTEQHFRTQLVKITYIDTNTGNQSTHWGILIEDTDEMAERLGGEECEDCYNAAPTQFRAGNLERLSLFQYMVGNTDWSTAGMRNIKVVRHAADGSLLAVPYDFDFAGTVMASYARPNTNVGQMAVGQRVWQWEYTQTPADLTAASRHFLNQREAVLKHVEQFQELPRASRREITKYLEQFFLELNQGLPNTQPSTNAQPIAG